jgi:DNA-binding XRE family transcriptional regulator
MGDLKDAPASNLRRLRPRNGWTQEELADRVGLSVRYVGQVERGQPSMSVRVLGRIAERRSPNESCLSLTRHSAGPWRARPPPQIRGLREAFPPSRNCESIEAIVVEPRAIMTPTRFLTVIPCHVSSDFSVGSAHSDCSAQAIAVGVRWRGGGRKGRPRSTYLIADRRLRTCIRQLFQNRLRCGSIPTMRLHHHCERTQILTARSLRRLVWARSASRRKVWRVVANCALWLERRFPPPER